MSGQDEPDRGGELHGYAPLPPPRANIADPNIPHSAYRRRLGHPPTQRRRPLLDQNARTALIIAASVIGGSILTGLAIALLVAEPIVLCPVFVLAALTVGTVARLRGWRPRQRIF